MEDRSRGILWYIIISFAITWGAVFTIVRIPVSDQSPAIPTPLTGLLSLLGTFGPAIGAFVVRKWITREGFKDAGLRLNLGAGWKYYLIAAIYPLVLIPVALGVAAITGAAVASLSTRSLAALIPLYGASIVWALVYLGEEFGWRGYLQVRVAPGMPLKAALLTGLIWGIWHYPFVITGLTIPWNPLALLIYPIDCILISIFAGWLCMRSESVWPVCLSHAIGNNVITNMVALLMPEVPQLHAWGVFTLAGYAVLALVLVLSRQVKWREMPVGQAMSQD